jgi:hypothetical protein
VAVRVGRDTTPNRAADVTTRMAARVMAVPNEAAARMTAIAVVIMARAVMSMATVAAATTLVRAAIRGRGTGVEAMTEQRGPTGPLAAPILVAASEAPIEPALLARTGVTARPARLAVPPRGARRAREMTADGRPGRAQEAAVAGKVVTVRSAAVEPDRLAGRIAIVDSATTGRGASGLATAGRRVGPKTPARRPTPDALGPPTAAVARRGQTRPRLAMSTAALICPRPSLRTSLIPRLKQNCARCQAIWRA